MDTPFASAGSQRWLQVSVERRPQLLDAAFRESGAIDGNETVTWKCPLKPDYVEYRDGEALRCLGVNDLPRRPLAEFWPSRGPVWDGLGVSSSGKLILVEAKAHIPEAASPGTQAQGRSLEMIETALAEARAHYAPKATARWSGSLYQYANRLAFHYLLSVVNGLPSRLVFLDFYNATDVNGPETIGEWKGATRLIHALLGLPADLTKQGVFHAYVDAKLVDAAL
jgi:hypothetical protein